MPKRHFTMLATPYKKGMAIGGWLMSEKLDGQRAIWDGGITRGLPLTQVPWANREKNARYVDEPISTGLWSRYGNPIIAPDWFLDQLPPVMLDGELYGGRGKFQYVRSVVSRLEPDDRWLDIDYVVFGMPAFVDIFADGNINVPNYMKSIRYADCSDLKVKLMRACESKAGFDVERIYLKQYFDDWAIAYEGKLANVRIHRQIRLPVVSTTAHEQLMAHLNLVISQGGEGLILRHPTFPWEPHRVKHLLKVKALDDAEAVVTGYVTGAQTDKGSKLLGMMGALVTSFKGKKLELSGFTDEERKLGWTAGTCRAEVDLGLGWRHILPDAMPKTWASLNPSSTVPDHFEATAFPRGSKVSFKYREMSDDGIPKEARYWRQT